MPRIDHRTRRDRVASARVGRLATITATGHPHVVPCCFVLAGDKQQPQSEVLYWVVDGKPKSTLDVKRLDNVRATPVASLVVDHYEDDWDCLWWIRVDGEASVLEPGPEHDHALALLADKYEQYRRATPPGAVMRITITHWADWAASAD